MTTDSNNSTLNRWRKLVEKLRYATAQGAIEWDEGTRAESITTEVKDNTITLRKVGNDFHVSVSDLFGDTIDSFTDVQLDTMSDGMAAFQVLNELYTSVKRQLSGADKILDEILEALPDLPARR
jgi:hypothetical protein